jgi:hypothetical protein
MSYLERRMESGRESYSKSDTLSILAHYRNELSDAEYKLMMDTLCSLALEGVYLNEKDILLNIAQLRGEITYKEIVALTKSA